MPEVATTVAPERGRKGPFTLAVSSEMVFVDLPVVERVRRLTALDVQVEIWDWTRHDLHALELEEEIGAGPRHHLHALEKLRDEGTVYSSMTGYVTGGLVDPDAADDLLASAARSVEVARRLGIPRLNLHGTGLAPRGVLIVAAGTVTGPMW